MRLIKYYAFGQVGKSRIALLLIGIITHGGFVHERIKYGVIAS